MKQLQELAGIPSRATVRQILKGNGQVKATESLTHKLYELIRKGDLDDDGMVKKLYGKNRTPSYGPYRTLKTRLRHVLIQAVLLDKVDSPKFRNYNEAYEHGFRIVSIVRMLMINRAYTAARELARQAFQKVRDFEIIPINHSLADALASLYLGVNYNEAKYNEYNDLSLRYGEAARDLATVQYYYRQVRNGIYNNRDNFYKVGLLAGSFTEECKSIAMKYPRISQIQSIVGDIEVTGCIHRGEYHKAIQALDSSLEKLQECKGVSSISLSLISINKVECTLKLRDFDLGIKQIEEAKLVIEQNTINGVKLSELAIQLGLATNNYLFAYRELVKMDKRMMNRLLGARAVEAWRILEAYLFFLLVAGKINLPEGEPEIKNFRLNKFLNEVPFYAKDKEGMNIQIIILQVLFLIVQKKYSKAIDKIESLERYCSRYLKEGENFRNNCFFKLLLCVIKANFNRVAAERKGKSVLDKMITKSGGNPGVIEIIPYERLWGILLDNLESTRKMQPTYQTA
jgi:hypothetical protein